MSGLGSFVAFAYRLRFAAIVMGVADGLQGITQTWHGQAARWDWGNTLRTLTVAQMRSSW